MLVASNGKRNYYRLQAQTSIYCVEKGQCFLSDIKWKNYKSFTSNSNEAEEDSRKPKWLNDNATRRDPDRRDNEKYSAFGTATMMSSTRDPGIAVMTGPRNLRIVLLKHDSKGL